MLLKRDSQEQTQKSLLQRFLFVLGIVFLVLYFALGLMFIFWKEIPFDITYKGRLAFGILLMVYSLFRFVRLWQNK